MFGTLLKQWNCREGEMNFFGHVFNIGIRNGGISMKYKICGGGRESYGGIGAGRHDVTIIAKCDGLIIWRNHFEYKAIKNAKIVESSLT